jgi:tetratricopeptide (TPR) repeat protein
MDVKAHSDFVMHIAGNPIFRGFGAPAPDVAAKALSEEPALVLLHLAATHYKMAVVVEVLEHWSSHVSPSAERAPALCLLINALEEKNARAQARNLYNSAIVIDPGLAEAHYGLARLAQGAADIQSAVASYERVLTLKPHRAAQPHAYLHANAHWEHATILEQQGRDDAALQSYRRAVALLDTFGVHHIRLARFLRRLGHLDEATAHYRRCMAYTHRYFPEFILPPLMKGDAMPPPSIDVIYTTRRGEPVIFWNGDYLALSAQEGSIDFANVWQFKRHLANGLAHRSATSIAALEDAD